MAREAIVSVTEGPGAGKHLSLAVGAKAIIGRAKDADLSIPHTSVSRQHVELEHTEKGVLVRDVGSRHGITLDGKPVPRDGALVAIAATLTVGSSTIRISRGAKREARVDLPGIRLEESLGQGALGHVFAAWQDPPGRRVAVKAIAPGSDEKAGAQALREHTLESRLDHPGIVKVFDLIAANDALYLVRELVVGRSLFDELKEGALAWRRVVAIGAEIAAALAHAHERGVLHRDVKPANILLEEPSGRAKLVDFDMARPAERRPTLEDVTRLTKTGDGLGTYYYTAPEQLLDAKRSDGKADLYGLGASLYHALSGKRPFGHLPEDEYVVALFETGPEPLEAIAREAPPAVRTVIERAMHRDSAKRPTAAAFAAKLQSLL